MKNLCLTYLTEGPWKTKFGHKNQSGTQAPSLPSVHKFILPFSPHHNIICISLPTCTLLNSTIVSSFSWEGPNLSFFVFRLVSTFRCQKTSVCSILVQCLLEKKTDPKNLMPLVLQPKKTSNAVFTTFGKFEMAHNFCLDLTHKLKALRGKVGNFFFKLESVCVH